jgi:hypothetical protein
MTMRRRAALRNNSLSALSLLSIGLHLWPSNAASIPFSASSCKTLLDLNWEFQRSQMPIAGSGGYTIRSLRFCMRVARFDTSY